VKKNLGLLIQRTSRKWRQAAEAILRVAKRTQEGTIYRAPTGTREGAEVAGGGGGVRKNRREF
jgi:hypothetical protein